MLLLIKKLHCGDSCESAANSFPPGELPTKKHVIKRIPNFSDYRTKIQLKYKK